MLVAEEIHLKLSENFSPSLLEVVNESENHRGHAGYSDGESHFHVTINAPAFEGLSRIARPRAVHKVLGADLVGRIHALGLTIGT